MLFRSIEVITDESDNYLNNAECNFTVRGPFGFGVCGENFVSGTILCISNGITIGLFIDLVSYILRKNIYHAARMWKKNAKIYLNENLQKFNNENFKLILISTYDSVENAVGSELCAATHRIANEFMFMNFEYIERINRYDDIEEIVKENIEKGVSRIISAGTKNITLLIRKLIAEKDIKQSDIIYI